MWDHAQHLTDPAQPAAYLADLCPSIRLGAVNLAACRDPQNGLQCMANEDDNIPLTQGLQGAETVLLALKTGVAARGAAASTPERPPGRLAPELSRARPFLDPAAAHSDGRPADGSAASSCSARRVLAPVARAVAARRSIDPIRTARPPAHLGTPRTDRRAACSSARRSSGLAPELQDRCALVAGASGSHWRAVDRYEPILNRDGSARSVRRREPGAVAACASARRRHRVHAPRSATRCASSCTRADHARARCTWASSLRRATRLDVNGDGVAPDYVAENDVPHVWEHAYLFIAAMTAFGSR